MNYAQEQRLRFIDCMLVYYGRVGRLEVCDFFGVGPATATRDFRLYDQLAPQNLAMNSKTKSWTRTAEFERMFP